jgi:hypothetical protein
MKKKIHVNGLTSWPGRTDAPCLLWPNGDPDWSTRPDGWRHREHGPAVTSPDGWQRWCLDGSATRLVAPARGTMWGGTGP